ncbi:PP2C family protein-serine/threonine phosphatase [Couchioplanes azureus]|uniref:PP2C family protein-serine/threonine phosphatase n=1 Tax=Couchioplanes caeruleus TaxID=56438 RepID=UPI0019B05B90|nr:PP2C family serine/threonine-protein phosphatase [Couchioplanes caeruleus]GGQ73486.1 protein phosphatase [Couchioplanes caeruleus subsp. azureus]
MEISTTEWKTAGRRLVAAAGSVVGTRYDKNYDIFYVDSPRLLAVVADGMGDGPASSTAGRTAVDTFVRHVGIGNGPSTLRRAVAEVQGAVRAAGRGLPDLTGCTLTAFVGDSIDEDAAWLVQLGDSRAYRLRDGLLELLTADHTAAWLGVLNGQYTPQSAQGRSARRRLTRYAGHPQAPEPDVLNVSLRPGDRILLCTDGVSDTVGDQDIANALAGTSNPARAVETLLGQSAGGDDNATAVLIHVM